MDHHALEYKLASLLNSVCAENDSNTPDFILAQYLLGCLAAFNTAVQQREAWHGRDARPTAHPDDVALSTLPPEHVGHEEGEAVAAGERDFEETDEEPPWEDITPREVMLVSDRVIDARSGAETEEDGGG